MDQQKILVIINCSSGRQREKLLDKIRAELTSRQIVFDLLIIENLVLETVVWNNYVAVWVGGGDGTVRLVAEKMWREHINLPILILPLGSANVLAVHLGLPTNLQKSLDLLVSGKKIAFDALEINGEHLGLVALGIGYDALAIRLTTRRLKRSFGALAYLWGMLVGIFHWREFSFSLTLDGRRIDRHAKSVVVFNIGEFWKINLGQNIAPRDGLLNVAVFRPIAFTDFLRLFLGVIFPRYFIKGRLDVVSGKRATIHYNKKVPLHVDGDVLSGATRRVEVHLLLQAVTLIVPESFRE